MDRHKRKHIIEMFSHYLTGGIVLLKGYDKSEHFHEHPIIVVALFVLGAFIIIATVFHRFFEKRVADFKTLLHLAEFIVLCLVSYYYWQEGKTAIPIIYLLAAMGNLTAAILFFRKKAKLLKTAGVHEATAVEKL